MKVHLDPRDSRHRAITPAGPLSIAEVAVLSGPRLACQG